MIKEQKNIRLKLIFLYVVNIAASGFFIFIATKFLLDSSTLIGIIDIVLFITAIVFDIVILNFLRRKKDIKRPLDVIPKNIYMWHSGVFLIGLAILLYVYYC
ncbi:hypothetical protein [Thermoanaerobacterium thermosaccharolyticum]|uniref:hypothetical protein n=1 Tax=Thermoanaerobacterium thermosaccharolyticum TaxID=1517 RepID=UPI001781E215|nr:hypothetical protein [Thermoanaerobacterium thermosaccharolyticum]MBE0068002.1 hypothetical protein [Thermoanaerobacterium thermosaccharolyticum]MBE0227746.1 hypothetical protein [Thermoanaerobacterium thermosaccharolyticum]